MNKIFKRLLLIDITVASAVLAIWWVCREPWRPDALLRAIPATASLAMVHEQPAERLPKLFENAALSDALAANGLELQRALPDSVRRRLGRQAAFAVFPDPAWPDEPAFGFVAWLGPAARLMRWRFALAPPRGVAPVGVRNGHMIWRLERSFAEPETALCFSFSGGAAVLCLARGEEALRKMLAALDGNEPSAHSAGVAELAKSLYGDTPKKDAGWIALPRPGAQEPLIVGMALEAVSRDSVALSFRPDFNAPEYPAPKFESLAEPLAKWLPAPPPALLAIPAAALAAVAAPRRDDAWARLSNAAILEQFGADAEAPAALALLTGEYSGAFGKPPFRARIPAVMFVAATAEPGKIQPSAEAILDALNAQYRYGLILNDSAFRIPSVQAARVEYTVENSSLPFAEEDLPAFALDGNMLLLNSNARSLENILRAALARAEQPEKNAFDWQQAARELRKEKAVACLWLDLEEGGKTVELCAALWKLNAGASGSIQARRVARAADALVKALRFLRPFKRARLSLRYAAGRPEIFLALGE